MIFQGVYNLFAYCENDLVNNIDLSGRFVIKRWMVDTRAISGILDIAFDKKLNNRIWEF